MGDDGQEIVGTWTVKCMQWTWFYTFTADKKVTWRDPLNNETGEGRWSLLPNLINLSWTGSTTKETWKRPVNANDQQGWVSASYGNGPVTAKKVPETSAPRFVKDPDTGTAGSWFTSAGQLWRQDIELGSSATIALKNYRGLTVGLNNPTIAKLVTWYYGDYLYVDVVPLAVGNANLEARSGDTVLTSIQIVVGSNVDGAIFVDDFAGSYYDLAYRRVGGDLSKWIVLEYKDSVVIDVNISDIYDNPSKPGGREGYIGEGGRRFPMRMDPATTPRLYAAKQRAIAVMNKDWADFLEAARDGIFFILTINPLVAPIQPQSIRPVNRSRLPRPVSAHFDTPPETPVTPRTAKTIQGKDVTEQMIRDAMKDASLKSQQRGGISLPKVQEFVDKLNAGETPPPIKVDDGIIVEGNHRYIAGRVLGREPPVQPWAGGRPERVIPWEQMPISKEKW